MKPPWNYALVPSYSADTRSFGELTNGEKGVLMAIQSYMNTKTFTACPGMLAIAEKAGIQERHARDCVRELERKGWLRIVARGGGASRTNTYALVVPAPLKAETRQSREPGSAKTNPAIPPPETRQSREPGFMKTNPAVQGTGSCEDKPGIRRTKTRHSRSKNPAISEQKPGTPEDRGTIGTLENSSNSSEPSGSPVAAAGPASEEQKTEDPIRGKLLSAGVSSRTTMDELLGGGLTPDEVNQAVGGWQGKAGKGVGILVDDLRGMIEMKRSGTAPEALSTTSRAEQCRRSEQAYEQREADERAKADAWCEVQTEPDLIALRDGMLKDRLWKRDVVLGCRPEDKPTKRTLILLMAPALYRFANRRNANKPIGACEHE